MPLLKLRNSSARARHTCWGRLLASSVVVACLLGANPMQEAYAKSRGISDVYITSYQLGSSERGYALKVPGSGDFRILSVTADDPKAKNCLIDRRSLAEIIRKKNFRAPPAGVQGKKREIKMKAMRQGNEVVCSGTGTGCIVIVAVWDPDDPVLPEHRRQTSSDLKH